MSEYILHLSDALLAQTRKAAKREQISLEQLFISTIAEKLAALEADKSDKMPCHFLMRALRWETR